MATGLADNIQLIASDLDGTLLLNGSKSVRKEAYPIIERVCDEGGLFLAASGRPHASLLKLFGPVADRIGYLCENGALVIWQGETLVEHVMPREIALEACHLAESIPGVKYFVSAASRSYALGSDQEFIHHLRYVSNVNVCEIERPEDIDEPVIKVAFMVEAGKSAEVNQIFTEHFGKTCHVVTSGTFWVDMIMDGVNKGVAIRELADVLGIGLADIAAFGDAENDREMLEAVGHPYLMDPCAETMLDLAPRCKRCTMVEDTLLELLGE